MQVHEIVLRIDLLRGGGPKAYCYAKGIFGGTYSEATLLNWAPLDAEAASKDPWVLLAAAYRELARERSLRVPHREGGED